jgi:hypothetical protein
MRLNGNGLPLSQPKGLVIKFLTENALMLPQLTIILIDTVQAPAPVVALIARTRTQ